MTAPNSADLARTIADNAAAALGATFTRCFYCRRNQHASCTSGETPCPCCDGGRES